jgi:hypothetical protein
MHQLSLSEIQYRFKSMLYAEKLPDQDSIGLSGTLEAYHRTYFARLAVSLAEDFPRLHEFWGAETFDYWMRKYLDRYPSRFPSLAQIGSRLPRFLAETEELEDQPWFAELAGLEYQRCLSAWSDPGEPCDFSLLASLPENEQMKQVLVLSPSARFFQARHSVHKEDISNPCPASLVLFRKHGQVVIEELTKTQQELLDMIRERITLGDLSERLKSSEQLSHSAMGWISEWTAQGLIAGFA